MRKSDRVQATECALRIIQTQGSGLVGGESAPDAPLYGEISPGSLSSLGDMLTDRCEFKSSSILLDVGSGVGKPTIYFAHNPGLDCCIGIECDRTRWCLSMQNAYYVLLDSFLKSDSNKVNLWFLHIDLKELTCFNRCTHIYSFTCG